VFVEGMRDMVRQHRNHPSVVIWSMCNEGHCQHYDWDFRDADGVIPLQASAKFQEVIHFTDPSRPASANMVAFGNNTMSINLDVQGFSHGGGHQGPQYRKAGFKNPVVNSECCSCRTLRGAYSNLTDPSRSKYITDWSSLNSECMASQTSLPLSNRMIAGSFVWTLYDYLGEPGTEAPGQPAQTSSRCVSGC
jgi:beta-galactosidase